MKSIEMDEKKIKEFIQWGSAGSEVMFDFPCLIFEIPNHLGFIAYRIESGCAIVFGDPICPEDETLHLTEAFHRYCQESKMNIVYIIVSRKFAQWAFSHFCHTMIEVCEELIFDPEVILSHLSHRLSYRVNHGLKHGLIVHEHFSEDEKIEQAILQVGVQWRRAKKGLQIHLGSLNFFKNRMGKRWFYVTDGEKVTAMAMLSKIEARGGWLLKFLITSPDAIEYTSELLMITILETLHKENCHFLTYGMVPVESLGEIRGLGCFSAWFARSLFNIVKWIFKLEQRKAYWQRYHPTIEPSYVLFDSHLGLKQLRALMKAFKIN
jgi:lysylphosphatidylglycerol synthetase-like protein (DUF2156 family)